MRELHTIAADIRSNWAKVNYAAVPYLDALAELTSIDDTYYADDARSIVLYFLANATAWRGVEAKRVKLELRAML